MSLLRLNGKGGNSCFGCFDPSQMVVIWPTIFLFFHLYVLHAQAMNPKVCKISTKKNTCLGGREYSKTDSSYILTTFWNLLSRNMMIS